MSDTSQPDGGRYDELRELLRSALPSAIGGKYLTRRRFFRAAMAAGAAVLAVTGQAQADQPINCTAQYNTCTTSNTCDSNTCTQTNVCNGSNVCNAPMDVCSETNSCSTENRHNNCGGGGNRCNVNLCSQNNTCDTNTCTQNRCYQQNNCKEANNCNPNYCVPGGNSCGAGNQCNNNDNVQPLPFPPLSSSMSMMVSIVRQLRGCCTADPFGFEY